MMQPTAITQHTASSTGRARGLCQRGSIAIGSTAAIANYEPVTVTLLIDGDIPEEVTQMLTKPS
jgi:hypothetical protein